MSDTPSPVRYCRCCAKNPAPKGYQICAVCRNGGEAAEQERFWRSYAEWLALERIIGATKTIN